MDSNPGSKPSNQPIELTPVAAQPQQLRAINIVPQQQTRQIILSKNQASILNRSLQTNGGQQSQIIVLAPANRGLNDQGIQFLIQPKPTGNAAGNIMGAAGTSNQAKIFVQAPATSVNLLRNIQMNKPRLSVEPVKPSAPQPTHVNTTSQTKVDFQSSSNSHIIGLLNSNKNTNVESTVTPKTKKSDKDTSSVSSSNQTVASLINSRLQQQILLQSNNRNNEKLNHTTPTIKTEAVEMAKPDPQTLPVVNQIQTNASIDSILNQIVLPDTRIFSTLLNKDAESVAPNEGKARENLKCKKVFIGNREHVILDNFNNLSDFKGDFNGLRSIAGSIAEKLNLPVSIPAFLMIEDDSSIEKIKNVLKEQNINPILIEMKNNSSTVNQSESSFKQMEEDEARSVKKVARRKKPETDECDPSGDRKLLTKRRDSFKSEPSPKPSTPRPKKKAKIDDLSMDMPKNDPIDQQFQLINQFIDTLNSNDNLQSDSLKLELMDVPNESLVDHLDVSISKSGVRKNSLNDCELNFDSFDVNMLLNDIELQKDFLI